MFFFTFVILLALNCKVQECILDYTDSLYVEHLDVRVKTCPKFLSANNSKTPSYREPNVEECCLSGMITVLAGV